MNYQHVIDRHFDASARHWKDLYNIPSLEGVIHQGRRSRSYGWIEELPLPSPARMLEVGCGAGLLAIDLARRNNDIDCIDSSSAMVDLAQNEANDAGVSGRLTVDVGDVHALAFGSDAFDLVVALGVVPFLHAPDVALLEMARVARPGGWVLLTSDNRYRLNRLLDPRYVPFPGREALRDSLAGIGAKAPSPAPTKLFSSRVITRMIEASGLSVERCVTIGFGPFTLLGKDLLSEARAIKVNDWLQARADRGVPGLRSVGAQHLILARKR